MSAECSNLAIDPIERVQVGAAFLATATEVSNEVTSNPDGSDWDLHVRLSVEAVYYGDVPGIVEFNDYAGFGCGEFQFEKLEVGDEIIVAVEQVPLAYLPSAPFEGHMVVWKRIDGGWSFFEEALVFGSNSAFYPGAPRHATTKADILQVIASWTMPQTDTFGEPPAPTKIDSFSLLVVAFALGLLIALRRFRPASRDIARR